MGSMINQEAWERLIDENILWLDQQPDTLECKHIRDILLWARKHKQHFDGRSDEEMKVLQAERDRLQARLDRLADYGLDARDVGDGDSNALWDRVDAFRSDPAATLSPDDVRALAEWWAGLHTLLSKLDAELVGVQAERERLLRAVIHAKNWFEGSRRENAAEIIRILNEVLAAAEAKL